MRDIPSKREFDFAALFRGMRSQVSITTALGEISEENARDPFRVLISTIISQRTRDEQTHRVSRALFKVFKTPEELAGADFTEIEGLIRYAGFYREKAKRIKEVSQIIHHEYHDRVPSDIGELLKLPGVGRKTANCVLVFGHNKPAIPVDTHVHRISNRLGLVDTKHPEETEKALSQILPRRYWLEINDLFVRFGKTICRPIGPRCGECKVRRLCDYGSSIT